MKEAPLLSSQRRKQQQQRKSHRPRSTPYQTSTNTVGKNYLRNQHQWRQRMQENEMKMKKLRPKTKKKNKKVLRTWVLVAIFVVPILVIRIEYYIDKIIGFEDIRYVYDEHVRYDPWELLLMDILQMENKKNNNDGSGKVSNNHWMHSLANISFTARTATEKCPDGQRRMININNPFSHKIRNKNRVGSKYDASNVNDNYHYYDLQQRIRKIPMIVHQQSKSRCLTIEVDRATIKWAFRRWSYYIHDEKARNRLFERYCGIDYAARDKSVYCSKFPLLRTIINECLDDTKKEQTMKGNMTKNATVVNSSGDELEFNFKYNMKVEIWKFLNLWIFGGLYVDLGLEPIKYSPSTITNDDDGLFIIDSSTGLLSTSVMAVSPNHPIMFYCVQYIILYLMTPSISSAEYSFLSSINNLSHTDSVGSLVLNEAFYAFRNIGKRTIFNPNISPGMYRGFLNRTVRLVPDGQLFENDTKHENYGHGLNSNYESRDNNNHYASNVLAASIFSSLKEREEAFKKMGLVSSKVPLRSNENVPKQSVSCLKQIYSGHHKPFQ